MVDLRSDLAALRVEEGRALNVPGGLLRERQVRGPRRWHRASLGAEHHGLEAESPSVAGAEVAGVVPPLSQSIVRTVVAWEGNCDRIGRARGCVGRRRL